MPMNTTFVRCRPSADEPPRGPADLVDDLGRRQVAPEAELAGGAERAADRAADLARDAQRRPLARPGPRRVAHEDRLDERAVAEPVERLLGQAAVRRRDVGRRERVEAERGVELGAQRGRQGPDLGRGADVPAPQGVGDLARPVAGWPCASEPVAELVGLERRTGPAARRTARRERRTRRVRSDGRGIVPTMLAGPGEDDAADEPRGGHGGSRPRPSAGRRPAGPSADGGALPSAASSPSGPEATRHVIRPGRRPPLPPRRARRSARSPSRGTCPATAGTPAPGAPGSRPAPRVEPSVLAPEWPGQRHAVARPAAVARSRPAATGRRSAR